jgi:hypothetical protein
MMFFAWLPCQVRHAWLAVLRLTPGRLMKFLQVARDAGVMRQSGAYHQFRHKIVLDHLGTASVSTASAARPAGFQRTTSAPVRRKSRCQSSSPRRIRP